MTVLVSEESLQARDLLDISFVHVIAVLSSLLRSRVLDTSPPDTLDSAKRNCTGCGVRCCIISGVTEKIAAVAVDRARIPTSPYTMEGIVDCCGCVVSCMSPGPKFGDGFMRGRTDPNTVSKTSCIGGGVCTC